MEKWDRFRLPLSVAAIYLAAAGIIQFFPMMSEFVFAREVTDPAIESLLGAVLLSFAGVVGFLSAEKDRSLVLPMVLTAGLLLVAINMIYFWLIGQYTLGTIVAPVALNLLLAAWLGTTLVRSTRAAATSNARR